MLFAKGQRSEDRSVKHYEHLCNRLSSCEGAAYAVK